MSNKLFADEINKLKNIENKYNSLYKSNEFLEYIEVNSLLPCKIKFNLKYIFNIFEYKKYYKQYNKLFNKLNSSKNDIDNHNYIIFEKEKNNFDKICGLVEGKQLDNQQIDAIVRNDKNQLVIAGAGTGKTTTIVGKVKYLLNNTEPAEILLLSFTNASALEMKERIKKETNKDLDVMTFHKIGLEIIKKSLNKNVKIFNKELRIFIGDLIKEYIKDYTYLCNLNFFLSNYRFYDKDEGSINSIEEYKEYLRTNKLTTLNGEIVKSYGELLIANYLFSNNIEYIYESNYKYEDVQYYPDFYLTKYDIYIEYFGIDENGLVAPFFKYKDNDNPSKVYNQSIEWKRKIHKKNNTKLIETYYYENKKVKLISNLENKLKEYKVKIIPKTNEEIFKIINQNNSGLLNETYNVFSTIINLIKSNNFTLDYIKRLSNNDIVYQLIEPLYIDYDNYLYNNNMIDFNDMINMSINCINNNLYIHNYKYVIVDEYQDISNSRYNLLYSLRKQKDYKLFCVGDDWQSIYRFNGSNIDLITNFNKYWGNTYISYIEKTHRFTSMTSILSSNFIMKNNYQYKKNISAKESNNKSIKFIKGYTEYKCIDFLIDYLDKIDRNSTIYFLGRYSFDIDMLKDNSNFILDYNNIENVIDIKYIRRKDLNIKFMTIHKSKGLQADYVVVLNNKNRGLGFPSKINSIPLIRLLLGNIDNYPYSEERRLFYVALTRAKVQTILLVIDSNKSIFIDELLSDYKLLFTKDNNNYICPLCGNKLLLRTSKYGKFIGCSNYPRCKYKRK